MKDYMLELYEQYMINHCICDRSDEECTCLSFDDFCLDYVCDLKEAWAELVYETECEVV